VAAGVYFRRKPDIYKRLMLASCFEIFDPVLERFYFSYGLPIRGPLSAVLFWAVLFVAHFLHRSRARQFRKWLKRGGYDPDTLVAPLQPGTRLGGDDILAHGVGGDGRGLPRGRRPAEAGRRAQGSTTAWFDAAGPVS